MGTKQLISRNTACRYSIPLIHADVDIFFYFFLSCVQVGITALYHKCLVNLSLTKRKSYDCFSDGEITKKDITIQWAQHCTTKCVILYISWGVLHCVETACWLWTQVTPSESTIRQSWRMYTIIYIWCTLYHTLFICQKGVQALLALDENT